MVFRDFYHDIEVLGMIEFFFGRDVALEYDRLRRQRKYRTGQAFMNALPAKYYNQLNGSIKDPFNKDTNAAVIEAIEYLTDPMAGVQERVKV